MSLLPFVDVCCSALSRLLSRCCCCCSLLLLLFLPAALSCHLMYVRVGGSQMEESKQPNREGKICVVISLVRALVPFRCVFFVTYALMVL